MFLCFCDKDSDSGVDNHDETNSLSLVNDWYQVSLPPRATPSPSIPLPSDPRLRENGEKRGEEREEMRKKMHIRCFRLFFRVKE